VVGRPDEQLVLAFELGQVDPDDEGKHAQRGILRNHDSLCFRGVLVGQQELMNCLHAISGPFEMT